MKTKVLSLILMAIASVCVFTSCSKDDDTPRSAVTSQNNGYISSDLLMGTWKAGDGNRYKLMIFASPRSFTLVDYVDGQETNRSDAIYSIDQDDKKLFKFSFSQVVANNHWDNWMYLTWQDNGHTQFVLSDSSDGQNGTLYVKQK